MTFRAPKAKSRCTLDAKRVDQFEAEFPCTARADWIRNRGMYFCGHPKVHSKNNVVSTAICRMCGHRSTSSVNNLRSFPTLNQVVRDRPCFHLGKKTGETECRSCRGNVRLKSFQCHHPHREETTVKECETCHLYDQRLDTKTQSVKRWAVGITTAPREPSTLRKTAESLVEAGWNEATVFAEPSSQLAGLPDGMNVVHRVSKMGAWANWISAISELYLRNPEADAYFILQDDVELCKSVRRYLEASLWPESRLGFVSLYSPSIYQGPGPYVRPSGGSGYIGALALVFPPQAVRSLLSSPTIWTHGLRPGKAGASGIDTALGYWAGKEDLAGLFHVPSLAQHTGDTSTIWAGAQNGGQRRADDFVGSKFDATQLLGSLATEKAPEKRISDSRSYAIRVSS